MHNLLQLHSLVPYMRWHCDAPPHNEETFRVHVRQTLTLLLLLPHPLAEAGQYLFVVLFLGSLFPR